ARRERPRHCAAERTRAASFDHLVGARERGRRDFEPQSPRDDPVDHEFEFNWLFDRNIARLRASQNLVHIVSGPTPEVWEVWAIGYQTACIDKVPQSVHGR